MLTLTAPSAAPELTSHVRRPVSASTPCAALPRRTSMACNLTTGQPKPQLASQRLSGEKAIETTQSFSLGNLRTMCSDFTSQIETCRSSPPEAKKRESEDQARQRTPAAQVSSETSSKCLSTSKTETLPDSPPTAKTFPEGEKAEVCSKSEKSMDATSGHSFPLWGTQRGDLPSNGCHPSARSVRLHGHQAMHVVRPATPHQEGTVGREADTSDVAAVLQQDEGLEAGDRHQEDLLGPQSHRQQLPGA
mmetsp:Transcript_147474/g.471586  ORF Transcript_147474/g.471586 Transcript_147474/m.471586 type:complete len:248 (+) Transcript_147474:536-1279(+)